LKQHDQLIEIIKDVQQKQNAIMDSAGQPSGRSADVRWEPDIDGIVLPIDSNEAMDMLAEALTDKSKRRHLVCFCIFYLPVFSSSRNVFLIDD
jgi:hypothetical protein